MQKISEIKTQENKIDIPKLNDVVFCNHKIPSKNIA